MQRVMFPFSATEAFSATKCSKIVHSVVHELKMQLYKVGT